MKKKARRIALLLVILTSGCKPADHTPTPPEIFGLVRTVAESKVVTEAIDAANAVLASDANALTFVIDTLAKPGSHQIPVSVLSSKHLSKSDVIWVPPGCKCVYIQARAIRSWLDRARLADGYGDPFDEAYVLAYMLLHEMGHIIHEDSGAYLVEEGSQTNMEGTDSKTAEAAADAFAKAALRKELQGDGTEAQAARAVISNIKSLTNNIYLANFLSQDLSAMLCLTPKLYWDTGYSHPNLVFRLMETVNELAPSSETKKIVSTYAECRDHPKEYFDRLN